VLKGTGPLVRLVVEPVLSSQDYPAVQERQYGIFFLYTTDELDRSGALTGYSPWSCHSSTSALFVTDEAPMMPHRVHTMRGPNVGTGT